MSISEWPFPPALLTLAADEVHVWRATLDLPTGSLQAFERTLSFDERERAARFRSPQLRQRFTAGRGILRAILGRYLRQAPEALCFAYTAYGKPSLAMLPGQPPLQFNLSHSAGLALYAVTLNRAVGVDVETIDHNIEHLQVAEHCFSAGERSALRQLPPGELAAGFFNCWTRKEAYIKAHGHGLSLPLDQFSVSLHPQHPARLLHSNLDPAEPSRWTLQDLVLGSAYVGALAVAGQGWRIVRWQWPA